MKIYTAKTETSAAKKIAADDMLLTRELPTAAGSRMLAGYMSLFEAEVLTRLAEAGWELSGKAAVGEFAIDLVGETAVGGAVVRDGVLGSAPAEILKAGDAGAVVCLDVNGSVRRAAAQNGLCSIKPTYGTVSRYGVIPVACSGETVSVMACCADACADVLDVIAGHDDKDGTSLSQEQCAQLKKNAAFAPVQKVAVPESMLQGIGADVREKLVAQEALLQENGITVCHVDDTVLGKARAAWNILMCAELCNNVSRYDGVKYGYRAGQFTNLDELYTNSRTEAFGPLLKMAILFGSETLSTENYQKVYDKAMRVRRVLCRRFEELFETFDAVLMPACSTLAYTQAKTEENRHLPFEENFYTAPASVTGLPAVVTGGVQLVGRAFSENALLALAKLSRKEGMKA